MARPERERELQSQYNRELAQNIATANREQHERLMQEYNQAAEEHGARMQSQYNRDLNR